MKREYERPSMKVRSFTRELLCVESNVTQARNALAGQTYSIKRENISVATLEKK